MTMEDKRQLEKLKTFDRTLKESTGQLAWFLYGMFAIYTLMMGYLFLYDAGTDNHLLVISYVCVEAWMVTFFLAPYRWGNETFSRRVPRSDSVSKILRYVPVSEKNYIRVRMGYLWKFMWKFTIAALLILLGMMEVSHTFSIGKIVQGTVLFLGIPMLTGYIEVKGARFF